ncbi:hypothetical protein [Okeania sp. KiyG1]|uniref:hypothetical protein n=1 Tax=Okeania sp. KiyG1 TaxID=2720165 RepID=UPI001F3AFD7C|nr:hypothetical protein [Okeania sp. KiyG1]
MVVHSNGRESVGGWGDGEMGDGGMGSVGEIKNIYPHHYHAGLPKNQINYRTEIINYSPPGRG